MPEPERTPKLPNVAEPRGNNSIKQASAQGIRRPMTKTSQIALDAVRLAVKHRRLCFLMVILVFSLTLGIHYKTATHSAPPSKYAGSHDSIELFVSDPNAQTKLSVIAYETRGVHDQAYADVQLRIKPSKPGENVQWVIRYRGFPEQDRFDDAGLSVRTVPEYDGYTGALRAQPVTLITGDLHAIDNRSRPPYVMNDVPNSDVVRVVTLKITSYEEGGLGEYSAHLPGIQNDPHLQADTISELIPLLVEQSKGSKTPVSTIYRPLQLVPDTAYIDPIRLTGPDGVPLQTHWVGDTPGTDGVAYFAPNALDVSETLQGASLAIQNSQVTSMVPLDGQIQGDDLIWHSRGLLEPSISATSIAFQEAKSTDDFYAGLAFATAAAALIACVQEIPPRENSEHDRKTSPKGRRSHVSLNGQPPGLN
jgi:hypothetical protein